MKPLLACFVLAAALMPVSARTETAAEAERTRIAAERQKADMHFVDREKECYRKFAVNDCLLAARAVRRELLADLRRQELSLNDAERKRRSAERVHSLERSAEQRQEESAVQRAEALARRRDKQDELAQRTVDRARSQASAPARATKAQGDARERQASSRAAKQQRTVDRAQELQRFKERQQEAKERAERVAKRLEGAHKPQVKPLPLPP
ncbi:MAG: hypothetical protein NVSMB34_12510 [Variovorax sp.]